MKSDLIRAAIRDVIDFPKPGIVFKDISPVLANADLFHDCISLLADTVGDRKIDKVVGIDARGFIFGAAVAARIGVGFVPLRKVGKLPWHTHQVAYALEYGEDKLEIHQDAVAAGESVLLVDDLLATGGTLCAAVELLKLLGADLVAIAVLIELEFLEGRAKLPAQSVHSVIRYQK